LGRAKIPVMVNFFVNGEPAALPNAATVVALLEARGLGGKRVAVEKNGEIVPKSQHATVTVADGDRIEIVVAVGGG
jgi:sulfur carrier protein